jgi:methylenetetrahydrofolate dehydrogenase (NADP+)/methenyltetrahydrofolate cyclohydrolase
MDIIHKYNIDLTGKHVVLVGRSNLIGKPLIACMLKENATVTVTHSRTVDLGSITRLADVIVVGVGIPRFIKADMVKEGSIVIDVGTNYVDDILVGDVDFDNVKDKTSFITPVPNGVGRMTVSSLMKNVIIAYKLQRELNN